MNLGASLLGGGTNHGGETHGGFFTHEGSLSSEMCQRAMVSTRLLGFKPRSSVVGGMDPGAGHHSCLADRSCLLFLCIQVEHRTLLSILQLLYTVGYSLSIVSLFLALTLLLFLR